MAKPDPYRKPSRVWSAWSRWKGVARRVGDFQARVLLTVCYFIVVAPFALTVKWGSDPLAIKRGTSRGWRARGEAEGTEIERAARQS